MLATFRETVKSLQDKKYGPTIISKPMGQVLWYWSKYLLLLVGIGFVIGASLIVYSTPQVPKLLKSNLPDATISIKDGKFLSTLKEPYIVGSTEFSLVVDSQGSAKDLDKYTSGILVLSDALLIKNPDGKVESRKLSDFGDFSTSRAELVSWTSTHNLKLAGIGVGLLLALLTVYSLFYWSSKLIGFFITGLIFWLIAKVIKRQLDFQNSVKIVIYASVLPLLLGAVLAMAPNQILSYVNLAIFLYFGLTWVWNLSTSKS